MNKLAITYKKKRRTIRSLVGKGMRQGMISMLLPLWFGAAKAVFSSQ